MNSNENKKKSGVAILRERFYERMKNWKPSPELKEAIKQKKPAKEKKQEPAPQKKIAQPKPRNDLDM